MYLAIDGSTEAASKISFADLVKEMVAADDELVKRRAAVTEAGYATYDRFD